MSTNIVIYIHKICYNTLWVILYWAAAPFFMIQYNNQSQKDKNKLRHNFYFFILFINIKSNLGFIINYRSRSHRSLDLNISVWLSWRWSSVWTKSQIWRRYRRRWKQSGWPHWCEWSDSRQSSWTWAEDKCWYSGELLAA